MHGVEDSIAKEEAEDYQTNDDYHPIGVDLA